LSIKKGYDKQKYKSGEIPTTKDYFNKKLINKKQLSLFSENQGFDSETGYSSASINDSKEEENKRNLHLNTELNMNLEVNLNRSSSTLGQNSLSFKSHKNLSAPKLQGDLTIEVEKRDLIVNLKKKPNDKLRNGYMMKLIKNNGFNSSPCKTHNSIIIFDWDDTLLCTTYLNSLGILSDSFDIAENSHGYFMKVFSEIEKLDDLVYQTLSKSILLGKTYIITNSERGWVQYSANKLFPRTSQILSQIQIISARGEFGEMFPGDNKQWKIQAFLEILKTVDVNLVTNLICLGDNMIEIEAANILASKFPKVFIKTIKFKEVPKPLEIIKQLKKVLDQFEEIYNSVKNFIIKIEKK
jgi:hypothetical protein